MKSMEEIRVSIVEDDAEVRELLRLIIGSSPGFSCTQVFADAESAIEGIPALAPHVVLQDIHLPGKSGVECIAELRPTVPETDFLVLTVMEDDESVFSALKAGAVGYLMKDTPPARLLEAIAEVRQGGAPMTPAIARRVARSFHPASSTPLSARETQILQLLADGDGHAIIGEKLFISGHTVRAHIKAIYRKLEVHSRAEAVREAVNRRLV